MRKKSYVMWKLESILYYSNVCGRIGQLLGKIAKYAEILITTRYKIVPKRTLSLCDPCSCHQSICLWSNTFYDEIRWRSVILSPRQGEKNNAVHTLWIFFRAPFRVFLNDLLNSSAPFSLLRFSIALKDLRLRLSQLSYLLDNWHKIHFSLKITPFASRSKLRKCHYEALLVCNFFLDLLQLYWQPSWGCFFLFHNKSTHLKQRKLFSTAYFVY